jgi:hypothetical protein
VHVEGYDDCNYVKEDERSTGQLECVDERGQMLLAFPFAQDPQHNEPTTMCTNGNGLWHRGYYTEVCSLRYWNVDYS